MEWSTLLTFAAGAIAPLVVNWSNAKLKYHYEHKGELTDQHKKEIRTYYLVRPELISAKYVLLNITENDFYSEIIKVENKYLKETVNKLKEISYEVIPLSLFESYYDCLGSLQHLGSYGNDVNDENFSQHLRNSMKEVHFDTQQKVDLLIDSYDTYINKVNKELK